MTKGAFTGRFRNREHENARGLIESDLIPLYLRNASCPEVYHIFGEPWEGAIAGKRHVGADIPAPWDEPVLAMADGRVVPNSRVSVATGDCRRSFGMRRKIRACHYSSTHSHSHFNTMSKSKWGSG